MGLFGKDNKSRKQDDSSSGEQFRGGCAQHQMRGPWRNSEQAAAADADGHGERMHGEKRHASWYVEG